MTTVPWHAASTNAPDVVHNRFSLSIAFVFAAAVILLAACDRPSADSLLKDARISISKGNTKEAIIELKGALQQRPDFADARLVLGKALLDAGEVTSAIVELRKALDANLPTDQVIPPLTHAMLIERQYQMIIDQFGSLELKTAAAQATLQTNLAWAYMTLGNPGKAQSALQDALRSIPNFSAALALQARIAAHAHRTDEAIELIDRAVAEAPLDPQAWFQKGEILLLTKRDPKGATEAFRKALSIQPNHMPSRSGLISALLDQRDLKAAGEQWAELQKAMPENLQTAYLGAQLALASQDYKRATELIEQAAKGAPNNVSVLQLAGTIHLSNGALPQAERSLNHALALQPNSPLTRRNLAQTLLRMGQSTRAVAVLRPLIEANNGNPQTYALAGEANILDGNMDQARGNFEKAFSLDPENQSTRTYLTLAKLKTVGVQGTIAELEKIAASDKGTNADLALISMLIKSKNTGRALTAIDAVELKLPGNPLPVNLRGRVQLMRQDATAARASFERALAIDPMFVPAAASLANLDLSNNDLPAAKKRFEAVLAVDPKNLDAQLAMVKLRELERAPKSEISSRLTSAVKSDPTAPTPRLLLINHHLAQRDFSAALSAAQDATAALPDQADLTDALGRAQMMAGQSQLAIISFTKLSGLEPKSTRPHMRLAGVHVMDGKRASAEQSLRRALGVAPNFLEAQQSLVKIAMADKRPDDALLVARTVQAQRPNDSVGYDLEASIQLSRNNRAGAENVYLKAIKVRPRTNLAIKLHTMLSTGTPGPEAEKMATDWLTRHPKDVEFLAYLGDLAMVQGHYDKAEKQFKSLIALQPANAAALNNIALTLVKQGKPGAEDYAERALKLYPNNPGLMDTLATVLAAEKQLAKALDVQKQALKLAPNDPALRLNLAKIQVEAGDKAAAATELRTLEKLGTQFPAHAEVTRMLKQL